MGVEVEKEDTEVFQKKMSRLTLELEEQFKKSDELQKKIVSNLGGLDYEF